MGVPYDHTSTYRPGSRFGPRAVREASLNIETYDMQTGIDIERVPIHDAGDLHIVDDLEETLRRLNVVTADVLKANKIPVCIGGEHSITLGVIRSLSKPVGVVSFDAHGDLRDEYGGSKLSHATVLRRISELVGTDAVFVCGIRAICKEEKDFIDENEIKHLSPWSLREIGTLKAVEQLRSFVRSFQQVYLTIDIDALDPAFAPGTGTPEFNGLTPDELLPLVTTVAHEGLAGFDLVEVCPPCDKGVTAAAAARLIFTVIAQLEKVRSLSRTSSTSR